MGTAALTVVVVADRCAYFDLQELTRQGTLTLPAAHVDYLLAVAPAIRPDLRLARRPGLGEHSAQIVLLHLWTVHLRTGFDTPVGDTEYLRSFTQPTYESEIWARDEAEAWQLAEKLAAEYTRAWRAELDGEPATVQALTRVWK